MTPSIKLWTRKVLSWVGLALAIFLPAGTLGWPEAWAFLGLYLLWSLPVSVWLHRHRPDLMEERLRSPVQRDQKGWDRLIVLASLPVTLCVLVIPGLDAVRFGWSDPPLTLSVAAFLPLALSLHLVFLTMRENAHLSQSVVLQDGHRVVTTGPYAIVRHPMYAAVIVIMLATPLALGSYWALVPGGLSVVLLVTRTVLEDRTLHQELPGYPAYADSVRFRLVPGLW